MRFAPALIVLGFIALALAGLYMGLVGGNKSPLDYALTRCADNPHAAMVIVSQVGYICDELPLALEVR